MLTLAERLPELRDALDVQWARQNKAAEWRTYVEWLRETNKRKRRLVETLDVLLREQPDRIMDEMQGISIKGQKLHEIQMPMVPYSSGVISFLRYPEHRVQLERQDDNLTLSMPAFLALELYRRGILPQTSAESVEVALGGKRLGAYFVVEVRYPNWEHEPVRISLRLKSG